MQTRKHLSKKFIEILQDSTLTDEGRVEKLIEAAFPTIQLTIQQAMVGALAQVMCIDAGLNGARLARLAAELLKRGATSEELIARYGRGGWYWHNDWRGKRGELPGEKAIRETFGRWAAPETQDRVEFYN